MNTAILIASLILGPPGNPGTGTGGNPMEAFGGVMAPGKCLKFNNGLYEQICSPADGQLYVATAAGAARLYFYTSTTDVGIAPPNLITDLSADNTTIHSENVWPGAAGAKTAGNLVLAGGLDSKTLVFDEANPKAGTCAGTTLVLTVNGTANTLTFNTICPGAGDCTTKAAACVAYAAAIEALSGVGATCSTETVYVTADQPATVAIAFSAETATCTTYSNGTDSTTTMVSLAPNGGCIKMGASQYIWPNATTASFGTACTGATLGISVGTVNTSKLQANAATVDIVDFDDWYDSTAQSSDATPTPVHTITGKPIYSGVANPTNGTGGSVAIIGAPGERSITGVTKANTAGDTITFVTCDMEKTCTSTVFTEGVTYVCAAAATDAECVLNLKTAIDAHATVGPATVTTCSDATCSDEALGIYITPGTSSYVSVTPSDGTNTAITNGADGQLLVGSGSAAAPGIAFLTDPDTGIYSIAANNIALGGNGASLISCASTGCNIAGDVSSGTGYKIRMGARSFMESPVDGYIIAKSNAGSTGGYVVYPQTITCADEGGPGVHSTCGGAATISSNVVQLVCNDADGCTLTLAETNYSATVAGNIVIHGPAANHVDVADSAGVLELAGGAAFAMDAADTLSISYSPLLFWAETARAAN